ncbi:hypothetical protein ACQFYA_21125 [Promicromonospora sp. Marseille-Q5078]
MATTSSVLVLGDDHLDLITTAAARWGVLTDATTAAFSGNHIAATPTQAGDLLRQENARALDRLATQGRTNLADRVVPGRYQHEPIDPADAIDPVEVIKAVHAAQHACAASPTWSTSKARTLLAAVATAATHRLAGYADAPWNWTRAARRDGTPLGVALGDDHPHIDGVTWLNPEDAGDQWREAPFVLVVPATAHLITADRAARPDVFVLTTDEDPETIWDAVNRLNLPSLVLHWPTCQPWLRDQIDRSAPAYTRPRSA